MPEDTYSAIRVLLNSTRPEDLQQGLGLVEKEIARIGSGEARDLFEILATLFYIDPFEYPELVPILDRAMTLMIGFGRWTVPVLIEKLDAGDMKAQFAAGNALGRIGADAVEPLLSAYRTAGTDTHRVFIIYAFGKIKSPRIVEAGPLLLEAASSLDMELRDTATRAIGKVAESIAPGEFPEDLRRDLVGRLTASLADLNLAIRAKAVRSLGKFARYGHLTAGERQEFQIICKRLLGLDEAHAWDRAYVVRREAKEALGWAER